MAEKRLFLRVKIAPSVGPWAPPYGPGWRKEGFQIWFWPKTNGWSEFRQNRARAADSGVCSLGAITLKINDDRRAGDSCGWIQAVRSSISDLTRAAFLAAVVLLPVLCHCRGGGRGGGGGGGRGGLGRGFYAGRSGFASPGKVRLSATKSGFKGRSPASALNTHTKQGSLQLPKIF